MFSAQPQITNLEVREFKVLNETTDLMIKTNLRGPWLVSFDIYLIFIYFLDAGFATNSGSSFPLGLILTLIDAHDRANIIHNRSIKSKRVTRSVLVAELAAIVQELHVSSTIRLVLKDMLDQVIPLCICKDSRILYECLTRINRTA